MFKTALAAVALLVASVTATADTSAAAVRFSILKTAARQTSEWQLYAGGRFQPAETVFSAILVQHGDDQFLFDSGLGRQIDSQYAADMPRWARTFFYYDAPVTPARDQLDAAGIGPIKRIIVSHGHWDHLSGLADFPGAEVWLSPAEHHLVDAPQAKAGGVWPSQVAGVKKWKDIALTGAPYEGFDASHDLYGDGRAVLVPMPGHTEGSIGLFLTVESGRRYFFVGDVIWRAAALKTGAPKFWAARWVVDHDVAQTQDAIERIRAAQARDPQLVVVPAHDGEVQGQLGYFPGWVR